MKSGKQRRAQLKEKRLAKKEKSRLAVRRESRKNRIKVNEALLQPTPSYSMPNFVVRGYYEDAPFRCKDCGKEEVWRDTQQKWWYEVMKGDVWTTALRCRSCRRKERERKTEARKTHLAGILKKNETKRST